MSRNSPFKPCGSTVTIIADDPAPTGVLVPDDGVSAPNRGQFRIHNAGAEIAYLGHGASAAAAKAAADGGVDVLSFSPGSIEVLSLPVSDYYSALAANPSDLLITPGQGTGGISAAATEALLSWYFSGDLNVDENAYIHRQFLNSAVVVQKLACAVESAPTGDDIIVTFKKGTLATGVLGATVGTVTISATEFYGETEVEVTLLPTEFLVPEITQIGSTLPGTTLTMKAFMA